MTYTEMRVKVAESVGWRWSGPEGDSFKHLRYWTPPGETGRLKDRWEHELPDYPNDLNAIHEVVLTLSSAEVVLYREHLAKIVKRDYHSQNLPERAYAWLAIDATARQRCEAYLRTKGLWKEQEAR